MSQKEKFLVITEQARHFHGGPVLLVGFIYLVYAV